VRQRYTKTDTPRHVPRPMCNISHVLAVADRHRSPTRAHAHTHTPHARRACKEVILGACLAHSSVSSIQSWWLVLPLRDTNLHRQTTHTHTERECVCADTDRERERDRGGRGRGRRAYTKAYIPHHTSHQRQSPKTEAKSRCIDVCACVPEYLCAYVPVCLCAYVPMCLCAYVPMCLCACVPMCLCACVCVNILVIIDGLGNAAGSLVPAARLSQIVCIFLHPVRLQLRPSIVALSSAP
jgi:hypothetical protein